jgi:hypothetical protein
VTAAGALVHELLQDALEVCFGGAVALVAIRARGDATEE